MKDHHLPHYPPPPCDCAGRHYRVKSGDTLYLIAQRFGVPLDALIAANPQIPDPNLIYPGQVICIPGVFLRDHCLILKPEPAAPHRECGGVCWIKLHERHTELVVVTIHLPDPMVYGHRHYFCRFGWEGQSHELPLRPMDDPIWFGLGLFPFIFPPAFFLGGTLRIFPGPVLSGVFI